MSEKVKLIIEIPESDYKAICENKEDAIIAHDTCRRIAKNGIPLDDVKAEIENLTYYWCEVRPRSVIDDVLKILDNIGKTESEDKE